MRKGIYIGRVVTGILFLFLAGFIPDHAQAGICGSTPCVYSTDIVDLEVKTTDLGAGVVTTGKLKNNAVTGLKVLDGSLTGADIQDGSITGTDIQDGSIAGADMGAGVCGTTQIADGAVTSAKIATSAVGTTQISDGSVASADVGFNYAGSASKGGPASDLSCVGCVSQSELGFSIPGNPAHRVVVATSGGDYTSVTAALAALSPTAADPYVIDVMPGVYTEHIDMKSYVHLRGAGREVTTIQAIYSYSDVITLSGLTNVAISGLTLSGGGVGIYNNASSWVTISGNSILGNTVWGIANVNSVTSITISGNRFVWNYHGIDNYYSFPNISGNWISDSTHYGILNEYSSPIINGNTILWNADYGIYNAQYSDPEIIHNHITFNGTGDIFVNFTSAPNISFNTYDDITGTTGVGMYNVNSSGGVAPAP